MIELMVVVLIIGILVAIALPDVPRRAHTGRRIAPPQSTVRDRR